MGNKKIKNREEKEKKKKKAKTLHACSMCEQRATQ
jgi:hypothetical protein